MEDGQGVRADDEHYGLQSGRPMGSRCRGKRAAVIGRNGRNGLLLGDYPPSPVPY